MADKNAKNNSFSEIIKGDVPVLVDFHAEWCGPCKMMPPILKKVKKELGNAVHIIKIDVDKNGEVAAKYQVRGVPTLILFHRGDILWRQSGVVQAGQLESLVRQKAGIK